MLVVYRRGEARTATAAPPVEPGGWRHVGYVYGDGLVPGEALHAAPPVDNFGTAAATADAGGQAVVIVRDQTPGERLLWTWERARPAGCTCELYASQDGRRLVQVPGACPLHGMREPTGDELLRQVVNPDAAGEGLTTSALAGSSTTDAPMNWPEAIQAAYEAIRDQPCGGYTPPEWATGQRRWGPDLRMDDGPDERPGGDR